jgi:hypothetical protein
MLLTAWFYTALDLFAALIGQPPAAALAAVIDPKARPPAAITAPASTGRDRQGPASLANRGVACVGRASLHCASSPLMPMSHAPRTVRLFAT